MKKEFRAINLDIAQGRPEVTVCKEDAYELGLHLNDRVRIRADSKETVAIVNIAQKGLKSGEIRVSSEVTAKCAIKDNQKVEISSTGKPDSLTYIKRKMDNLELLKDEYEVIVKDVLDNHLSDIELSAFISALYINDMTMNETEALARTLAETGEIIDFGGKTIYDKHSIGGVPGNKVSLLIVPIVAAAGLTVPKTSSRAITSASGTADTMEVLAPVTFNSDEIVDIVNETNGIICWGGGVNLAPADDVFINVEHPLALDPHNLAICSVMAKKIATSTKHLVMDLPMGEGTKIKDISEAEKFAVEFIELGRRVGIKVDCLVTYGDKPVGRAVGPSLEAREALRALEGDGASSLIEKSADLSGVLLEAGGVAPRGEGKKAALKILRSGKALKKMKEIIQAQGGDNKITSDDIEVGKHKIEVKAEKEGYIVGIDNKAVVNLARASGAPKDKGAGLLLLKGKGQKVSAGDVLLEVYSNSRYKLYDSKKLARQDNPVKIEGMLIKRIPTYSVSEEVGGK